MDDLGRTATEVEDGRTLQFFAFRGHFITNPPNWITWDDVTRAAAAPASAPESQDVDDADVLETADDWPADTWIRITGDDERVPISHAQAELGVTWDTTGVAQGTYVLGAYTWDPARNAWSVRWGAIRVVDDASDLTGAPPSIFFPDEPGLALKVGESHVMALCVAAMEGSTVTASYAVLEGALEPTWIPWLEDEDASEGAFELKYVPDPSTANRVVRLKAEITDPQGRAYTAYSPPITVVPEAAGEDDDNGGDDETETDSDSGQGGGGGCYVHPSRPPTLPLAWCVLMWVVLHRTAPARRPTDRCKTRIRRYR